MAQPNGKRNRSKKPVEHRFAGVTFRDLFTQTVQFKATTASGPALSQSIAHELNIGRTGLPKHFRVRVDPPTTEETIAKPMSNATTDEKTQVCLKFSFSV